MNSKEQPSSGNNRENSHVKAESIKDYRSDGARAKSSESLNSSSKRISSDNYFESKQPFVRSNLKKTASPRENSSSNLKDAQPNTAINVASKQSAKESGSSLSRSSIKNFSSSLVAPSVCESIKNESDISLASTASKSSQTSVELSPNSEASADLLLNSDAEASEKNEYIDSINKRLRYLRKRLQKIEKNEELMRANPAAANSLFNADQLLSMKKKPEVVALIAELESISQHFEAVYKENQVREAKRSATKPIDEKATSQSTITCSTQTAAKQPQEQVTVEEIANNSTNAAQIHFEEVDFYAKICQWLCRIELIKLHGSEEECALYLRDAILGESSVAAGKQPKDKTAKLLANIRDGLKTPVDETRFPYDFLHFKKLIQRFFIKEGSPEMAAVCDAPKAPATDAITAPSFNESSANPHLFTETAVCPANLVSAVQTLSITENTLQIDTKAIRKVEAPRKLKKDDAFVKQDASTPQRRSKYGYQRVDKPRQSADTEEEPFASKSASSFEKLPGRSAEKPFNRRSNFSASSFSGRQPHALGQTRNSDNRLSTVKVKDFVYQPSISIKKPEAGKEKQPK